LSGPVRSSPPIGTYRCKWSLYRNSLEISRPATDHSIGGRAESDETGAA
jgi:hypothetical protein